MTFQVLSLSGGGFLGLYTVSVLAAIEEQIGGHIADRFDLIAGTSVGGIIGLGLASRVSAKKIRDTFIKDGPTIFSPNPPPQSQLGRKFALTKNIGKAKYETGNLRKTVETLVGKRKKIGDLQHRVIIPAINLTKGAPQVFKTDHHKTFVRDCKLLVADVALATSAAPTFFPLHMIGSELFADGSLYANSPDEIALHEALHFLKQPVDDIRMLSIGTTTSKFSFSNSGKTNLGWMGWMDNQRLPRVMISAQQQNAGYILGHRLGERYLRIDHEQSPEQERSLALDVASPGAIADLSALAESSVRMHLGRPILPDMLQHQAAAPTFYSREA